MKKIIFCTLMLCLFCSFSTANARSFKQACEIAHIDLSVMQKDGPNQALEDTIHAEIADMLMAAQVTNIKYSTAQLKDFAKKGRQVDPDGQPTIWSLVALGANLDAQKIRAFCSQNHTQSGVIDPYAPSVSNDDIVLYPKDADLALAPNIIVEPQSAPFNLGGWKTDNMVIFRIKVKRSGNYAVYLDYSKPLSAGSRGKLSIFATKDAQTEEIEPNAQIEKLLPYTGSDWSEYESAYNFGTISLQAGEYNLALVDKGNESDRYVMNLRRVHLKKQ